MSSLVLSLDSPVDPTQQHHPIAYLLSENLTYDPLQSSLSMDRETRGLQATDLLSEGSGDTDLIQNSMSSDLVSNSIIWLQDNITSFAAETSASSLVQNSIEMEPYSDFLNGTRFWVQKVLVPILMVTGVIGNAITIAVMTRRRMRSSTTNNYLAALAIVDMLYLIFTFLLSFRHYSASKQENWYVYWCARPYFIMLADACSNSSVWLTVTFTIERFIVVSHPIQGKVWCTESRARKIIFSVFLVCFAWTIPTPFEYVMRETFDPETNATSYGLSSSDLGKNMTYKSVYYWSTVTLFIFVPLVLLTVFNAFLIRSVHVSRRTRQDMTQTKSATPTASGDSANGTRATVSTAAKLRSVVTSSGGVTSKLDNNSSSNTQETKITVMLIAVVILFLICQLPTAVMLIIQTLHEFDEGTKGYYLSLGFNNIFNFLVAINSAGNFLLYCFFSQRYRRTFVSIFCPCYKRHLRYLQSTTNTTAYSTTTAATTKKGRSGAASASVLDHRHPHSSRETTTGKHPALKPEDEEMQELMSRPTPTRTPNNSRSNCQTVSPAEETTPFLVKTSASSPPPPALTHLHRDPYSDSAGDRTADPEDDELERNVLKDLPDDGLV